MRSSLLVLLPFLFAAPGPSGGKLFIESARLNGEESVTFPLYRGTSDGRDVYYILTDASDGDAADRYGVNESQKLENARGSAAVMRVRLDSEKRIEFPATVDFGPERIVVPDPVTGFPPLEASPGSVGEEGYSPLVQLPDGTVLNAPHVANDTGIHDRVVDLDLRNMRVTLVLVHGFSRDEAVLYVSTDASDPGAAALEASTYAPALNAAPGLGNDGTDSPRTSLAAFTNGPTGVDNRERQGLNSALLCEGDPLNVLAWLPNQGRYSPLWDVFLTTYVAEARQRQERFADVEDLAKDRRVTSPDGGRWGPSNFIVNCPIVKSLD